MTVYVEQFTAHPLEADAAHLYGPPDGYLNASGAFVEAREDDNDRPVYRVTLDPQDGLYLLPYVATRADGTPWDGDGLSPEAPADPPDSHTTRMHLGSSRR